MHPGGGLKAKLQNTNLTSTPQEELRDRKGAQFDPSWSYCITCTSTSCHASNVTMMLLFSFLFFFGSGTLSHTGKTTDSHRPPPTPPLKNPPPQILHQHKRGSPSRICTVVVFVYSFMLQVALVFNSRMSARAQLLLGNIEKCFSAQ